MPTPPSSSGCWHLCPRGWRTSGGVALPRGGGGPKHATSTRASTSLWYVLIDVTASLMMVMCKVYLTRHPMKPYDNYVLHGVVWLAMVSDG